MYFGAQLPVDSTPCAMVSHLYNFFRFLYEIKKTLSKRRNTREKNLAFLFETQTRKQVFGKPRGEEKCCIFLHKNRFKNKIKNRIELPSEAQEEVHGTVNELIFSVHFTLLVTLFLYNVVLAFLLI